MKKKDSEASNAVAHIGEQLMEAREVINIALNQIHDVVVDVVSTEARLETSLDNIQWLKEQWLAFADHKDECEIRSSADEGRIVEGVECSCGFEQLRVQFNSDLR